MKIFLTMQEDPLFFIFAGIAFVFLSYVFVRLIFYGIFRSFFHAKFDEIKSLIENPQQERED